jgi:HK97 family phage prohead protease
MTDTLLRTFAGDLEAGDGRTIVGRAVPFDEVAEVSDDQGATTYRESFAHGAFSRAARAPHRVELTHEHDVGLFGTIGKGVELEERDDGLYGVFRVFEGAAGDQALTLVREGITRGLSIVAIALSPGKRRGGVLVRTSVALQAVGLCRRPAYDRAEVLAVRSAFDRETPRRNVELDERLAALGIAPPA